MKSLNEDKESTSLIGSLSVSLANTIFSIYNSTRVIPKEVVLRDDIPLEQSTPFRGSMKKLYEDLRVICPGSTIVLNNETIHKEQASMDESSYLVACHSIDYSYRLKKHCQMIKAIAPDCSTVGEILDHSSTKGIWLNEFGPIEDTGVTMRICVLKNARPILALALNYINGMITVSTHFGDTCVPVPREGKRIQFIDICNSEKGNMYV